MTGFGRVVLVGLLVAMALGSAGRTAAAQGGVDFADMPGIQQAATRTFSSPSGRDVATDTADPRELRTPAVVLLLTAVYVFDTEVNAAAAYQLLQTDMNATGFGGQPLSLTPISLPVSLDHTAAVASDTSEGATYAFTLAMAHDGVFVYTVIGITSGGSPSASVAATLRQMAAAPGEAGPGTFDPAGASRGGPWAKMPTQLTVERNFRGIAGVDDAVPFPA